MRIPILLAVIYLMYASAAGAQSRVLQPSTELSAEDVVSIQLKALSETENDPATDSGVRRVWAFAHPKNKRLTGPLSRFRAMLRTRAYRPLIGHRRHFMRQVSQSANQAHFAIRVTSANGAVWGYSWRVAKVGEGAQKGMWMTTGVVLVGKLGNAL